MDVSHYPYIFDIFQARFIRVMGAKGHGWFLKLRRGLCYNATYCGARGLFEVT